MSDRERQRRAEQSRRAGSFTLREWCEHRRISAAMYYKMAAQGLGPRTHYAGAKVLISDQADADWVAAREAAGEPQVRSRQTEQRLEA
jgi:hypothetical protein